MWRAAVPAALLVGGGGAAAAAAALRIARMEIRTKEPLAFLFLRTEDGREGMGQMGRSQMDSVHGDNDLVAQMFLRHVAPVALGADVSTPAALAALTSDVLYKSYKRTGQLLSRAVAGLDTAAWDLMARARNVSVCELAAAELGRDPAAACAGRRIPVYCTNLTRDITKEQLVDLIVDLHSRFGARAYKYKIARTMGRNVDQWPNRTEETIPFVRREVDRRLGKGVALSVDANGGYEDVAHAAPIARLLAQHGYEWFEEPVPFWDYRQTKEMNDLGLDLKFAMGENEYRWLELKGIVENAVVSIVQPDMGYAGGFSPSLRVAEAASRHGAVVDPHTPDLSMTEFFSLHLMAAVPNPGPFLEYGCTDESTPTDVFVKGIECVDGSVAVPQVPGWGVQVRDAWLRASTSVTYPPSR